MAIPQPQSLTGPRVAPSIGGKTAGLFGIRVQRWRQLTQTAFFLLFIFSPVFDIFRLDLNVKHFIFFGLDWTLGLDDFLAGRASAAQASLNIVLRGFLPLLGIGSTLIYVSWKWGRLYCGWLCPHFSVVETINQTLRRAIGKQSLWDKKKLPARNPDGTRTPHDAIWWFAVIPLVVCCAMLWAVVLLTYLLPPAEIYGNIWHGTLTRNQTIFLTAGSIAFFIEFMFARHLFCRYACAIGFFQSLAWMANDKAMVVGFKRERAKDCSTCFSACDHVCPMRLNPRNVKRMMFACVQCGQCVDACEQTQEDNPNGQLLNWVHDLRAESEAAFNVSEARVIMMKRATAERKEA
ncbi:4Fe-4S binding protein [Noviherbaspirillum sp.]|uniref:4Fe-4S binding protein n=1 Tax=Noviherbaspirillum sp. TaxID=1926288 RepID=UPI002B46A364|nr:4Fe-4S binding protein [Noviherbaspirillum sp.]HJV83543.1 4Fe-4S binding protein [Noviherbaspirillum sp.]